MTDDEFIDFIKKTAARSPKTVSEFQWYAERTPNDPHTLAVMAWFLVSRAYRVASNKSITMTTPEITSEKAKKIYHMALYDYHRMLKSIIIGVEPWWEVDGKQRQDE